MLFFLAEALLEYEQRFAPWRFPARELVERIIGRRQAEPAATLGARYLQRTIEQRFLSRSCGRFARSFSGMSKAADG